MNHHDRSFDRSVFKRYSSALIANVGWWMTAAFFSVSLCAPSASATATLGIPPGASQDQQICKGSAGYTWSAVRGSCIRLFEIGLAFTPELSAAKSSIHLAYVVLATPVGDVIQKAEVFIPGENGSISLEIIDNQEGDIRPILLVNKRKKVRIYRVKDDHILEFKGDRYRRSSPPDDPLFKLR
jgi:hypothetical protein